MVGVKRLRGGSCEGMMGEYINAEMAREDSKDAFMQKSIALNRELDTAGTFLYKAMKQFCSIEYFDSHSGAFMFFYFASVGLERLQKVLLILLANPNKKNYSHFVESIKTHSHAKLHEMIEFWLLNPNAKQHDWQAFLKNLKDRDKMYSKNKSFEEQETLRKKLEDEIKGWEKELEERTLVLLTPKDKLSLNYFDNFYDEMRYGKFNPTEMFMDELWYIKVMIDELCAENEVDTDFQICDNPINDIGTKRLIGKLLSRISRAYYNKILEQCNKNSLYTFEMGGNSQSLPIFWREKDNSDFSLHSIITAEQLAVKEFLLYLSGDVIALDFNKDMCDHFASELQNGYPMMLVEEIRCLYGELRASGQDTQKRFAQVMGMSIKQEIQEGISHE